MTAVRENSSAEWEWGFVYNIAAGGGECIEKVTRESSARFMAERFGLQPVKRRVVTTVEYGEWEYV